MAGSFLAVVLCLFLSWSAGDQVSSDAVTTSAAASPSYEAKEADHTIRAIEEASGKQEVDGLIETTTMQSVSDSVRSESSALPSSPAASSPNPALDLRTITTVEGTTADAVSTLKTTDTIEFRVLVSLPLKLLYKYINTSSICLNLRKLLRIMYAKVHESKASRP